MIIIFPTIKVVKIHHMKVVIKIIIVLVVSPSAAKNITITFIMSSPIPSVPANTRAWNTRTHINPLGTHTDKHKGT